MSTSGALIGERGYVIRNDDGAAHAWRGSKRHFEEEQSHGACVCHYDGGDELPS